jgi:hypothetical protein
LWHENSLHEKYCCELLKTQKNEKNEKERYQSGCIFFFDKQIVNPNASLAVT